MCVLCRKRSPNIPQCFLFETLTQPETPPGSIRPSKLKVRLMWAPAPLLHPDIKSASPSLKPCCVRFCKSRHVFVFNVSAVFSCCKEIYFQFYLSPCFLLQLPESASDHFNIYDLDVTSKVKFPILFQEWMNRLSSTSWPDAAMTSGERSPSSLSGSLKRWVFFWWTEQFHKPACWDYLFRWTHEYIRK